MRAIPAALDRAFQESLDRRGAAAGARREARKWLRYYLDFCGKYGHPERARESLLPFLRKLAEKGQNGGRQRHAARCVDLFYEVVQRFPLPEERRTARVCENRDHEAGWPAIYRRLEEAMRLRQNSPKTLKTYRTWIRQFAGFLEGKQPCEIASDDAVRFLTYLATERRVVASTQNQAFNALLFLFRHILDQSFDLERKVVQARIIGRSKFSRLTGSRFLVRSPGVPRLRDWRRRDGSVCPAIDRPGTKALHGFIGTPI